jgi:uncharacterized integral membrane protein
MGIFKWTLFFLILAAAITFAIQNDQPVSLRYYFGWVSHPLPLFLWTFLSFTIGLILSALMGSLSKVALHSRIRQQEKALAELDRKHKALQKNDS